MKDNNESKLVRFNNIIKVILIPSIKDDCIKNNKDIIWYNNESYKYFINDAKNILLDDYTKIIYK
jgi:hypothetical protein